MACRDYKVSKTGSKTIGDLELVARGLNEKNGVEVYDFSNVLRAAINYYLGSDKIKEMLETIRRREPGQDDLLIAGVSSLGKDWLKPEDDGAWADL